MADKRITSRFKVYMTRIGVRDWLVAAESQKAALKAWDVHRNLFSTGEARVTNDAAHVALAMKTPGLPVPAPGRVVVPEEKGRGSNVVRLATARPAKPEQEKVSAKQRDTSKLDAAEQDLRAFERDAVRERAEIEKRKRAVETELEAFDAVAERKRILLMKRIKREQDALKD
jgi:nucleotide-binding universal stress UspA family protein